MFRHKNGKIYDDQNNIIGIIKTDYSCLDIPLFYIETEFGNSIAMESLNTAIHEGFCLLQNPEKYLKMKNELNN